MSADGEHRFWKRDLVVFILNMLVVLAFYGDVLNSWWNYDDPQILKHALRYTPFEYFAVPDAWRALIPYSLTPWLTLSYDIDLTLFGLNPTGFYAHNLFVLVLTSFLIYLISRQWVGIWFAFSGGLLFLSGAPIAVASLQLMVRHYTEGLLFYLLAFFMIIRGLRSNQNRYGWIAGFFFAIAASAKEIYLPLGFIPFLLPVGSFRQRLEMAWPLLLVMLLYVPWRWYMLGAVVGGYTPSGELGCRDVLAAIGQFANIPGLLLLAPWLGLSSVGLAMGLLLARYRKKKFLLFLPVAIMVLLLAPLVPLSRMLVVAAGSERFFVALWAAVALGCAIVFGLAAAGRSAGWMRLTALVMLVMLVSAAGKTRQVIGSLMPVLYEQNMQGRALIAKSEPDIVFITPTVLSHFTSGLIDLRGEMGQTAPPPSVVLDEWDLSEYVPGRRRVFRYDPVKQEMIDISTQVPAIVEKWRKELQPASLSVEMEFDARARILRWQLGPQEKGTYTLLEGSGRLRLPPHGALRMDKLPEPGISFRFRYDSPEGCIAYTPLLPLVSDGDLTYRVAWRGTGVIPLGVSDLSMEKTQ